MKLLIADDMPSVHRFIEKSMDWRKIGIHTILQAYDGDKCLAIVNQEKPDILLLDIRMPGRNGLEVLQALADNPLRPATIILSAYDEFQYAQAGIRFKVSDYILKPIDSDVLEKTLRKTVENCRRLYHEQLRLYLLDYSLSESDHARILPERLGLRDYCIVVWRLLNKNRPIQILTEILSTDNPNGGNAQVIPLTQQETITLHDLTGLSYESAVNSIRLCHQNLLRLFGEDLMTGISDPALAGRDDIRQVYGQCQNAISNRFFLAHQFFINQDLESCISRDDELVNVVDEHKVPALDNSEHGSTNRLIDQVRKYITDNSHTTITLDDLSREFYISKFELCRKFKAITSENIWSYIMRMRMDKAHTLLLQSDLKVYEIAEKVGFNNSTYFSLSFKKFYGVSPTQIRSESSANP